MLKHEQLLHILDTRTATNLVHKISDNNHGYYHDSTLHTCDTCTCILHSLQWGDT